MKNIRNIFIISTAILGGWLLGTHAAHAQDTIVNLLGYDNVSIFISEILANLINLIQSGVSWILALSGFLLNYSINLTLQMKSFLVQTPAVFTTWKALRDISGLFIIFTLLYAALRLILGLQDAKFGTLIKNIVVAGVVINFSFFFAGLGIDVSNIVSIQLYNAIAPANTLNAGNLSPSGVVSKIGDGGLSDVFMKSLKIPALYNPDGGYTAAAKTAGASGAIMAPIKIILIGIASIMIMITAALSFAAAALAFVIRFVVLIFLLAFSPIWFASHIVPEIGEYAKKWTNLYKGMLVFMPVYLLLMYLALSVLTTTPLLNGVDVATAAGAAAVATNWYSGIITLVINAVIVIVLLNFPLVAAVSVSAGMLKFINTGKLGTSSLTRRLGNISYQNTVARGASRIARSEGFQTIAAKSWIGEQALKGTRAVATDYNKKLDTQIKSREDFAKSLDRNKAAKNDYAQRLASTPAARLSMFGTIGRSDRIAAAKILRNRLKEVKDDMNKLNSEENSLNGLADRARTGGRPLTPTEEARLRDIPREMDSLQNAITEADRELTRFQSEVGTTAGAIEKQGF